MGRATQGVRLISLKGDEIASIAKVPASEEEEEIEGVEGVEAAEGSTGQLRLIDRGINYRRVI